MNKRKFSTQDWYGPSIQWKRSDGDTSGPLEVPNLGAGGSHVSVGPKQSSVAIRSFHFQEVPVPVSLSCPTLLTYTTCGRRDLFLPSPNTHDLYYATLFGGGKPSFTSFSR